MLEAAAELGARYVNAICDDPDLNRLSDEFGRLVEAAAPYGIRAVVEFMAYRSVRTLADAVAIAARSGGGGILVDALHVQRCGVRLAELRAVDPGLISYVQLCDAPLEAPRPMRCARPGRRDCCRARASSRCWTCWPRFPTTSRSRSRRRAERRPGARPPPRSSRRGRGRHWISVMSQAKERP